MKGLCGVLAAFLFLGCAGCGAPAVSPAPTAASSAEGVFAAAIRGRRPVAFVYNGVSRVALPHRLGASAAGNGKTLVRCWEVTRGGAQDRRPAPAARRALHPRPRLYPPRPRHPRAHGGG